jgi:3-deoxy-D-manno-octulosonic-acid transferase
VTGFTAIAAQSEDDARRLSALGATHARVTGSVKFDVMPPPAQLERGLGWRAALGARPVLTAASTREGEETLILDALADVAVPGLLTFIVPRHPQRFDEVAALLAARGIRYQRRSDNAPIAAETQIVLGDTMGELFAYYAACDVAFIGGSLVPVGGQNLIEAGAVGRPVLVGPSTYNFAEAAELALAAGAAIQVADTKALAREVTRLLLDPAAREWMAGAALDFCSTHRGATQRVLELVKLRES